MVVYERTSKQLEIDTSLIWLVATESHWLDSLLMFDLNGNCEAVYDMF